MNQSKELIAVNTLAAAASLYLNTLDDFSRPIVSAQLQNCVNILLAAITPKNDTKQDAQDD